MKSGGVGCIFGQYFMKSKLTHVAFEPNGGSSAKSRRGTKFRSVLYQNPAPRNLLLNNRLHQIRRLQN